MNMSHDNVDLIRDHARFVRNLARRLVFDENAADDIAQQAWLTALQSPPSDFSRIRSWLRTVTGNLARRQSRDTTRRVAREQRVAASEGAPATIDLVARESILEKVTEAVSELPSNQREVILLRYFEDLPPRNIAKRLGVPVTTVQSRLQRGLTSMRRIMDRKYGENRQEWQRSLGLLLGLSLPEPRPWLSFKSLASVAVIVSSVLLWTFLREAGDSDLELPVAQNSTAGTRVSRTADQPPIPDPTLVSPGTTTVSFWPRPAREQRNFKGRVSGLPESGGSTVVLRAFCGTDSTRLAVDPKGWFTGSTSSWPRRLPGLWASSEDGSMAAIRALLPVQPTIQQPHPFTMALRPAAEIDIFTRNLAGVSESAEVALYALGIPIVEMEMTMRQNVFLGIHKTNRDGRLSLGGLIPGDYLMLCRSKGTGLVGELSFSLDGGASLQRSVILTEGRVLKVNITPVRGAKHRLPCRLAMSFFVSRGIDNMELPWPWKNPIVDVARPGSLTLKGLPKNRFLKLLAHRSPFVPYVAEIPGGAETWDLNPGWSMSNLIRFSLKGSGPLPPLELLNTDSLIGVRALLFDNQVVLEGLQDLDESLLILSADGRVARVDAQAIRDRSLSFSEQHFLEVRVLDERGKPQPGVLLTATSDQPHKAIRHVRTDSLGCGRLGPFATDEVYLFAGRPDSWLMNHLSLGTAKLGEETKVVTLRSPRQVELQFTIDGRPGLPADYRLAVRGALRSDLQTQDDAGLIRFHVWPDSGSKRCTVGVVTSQYGANQVLLDLTQTGLLKGELSLKRLSSAVLTVQEPDDGLYEPAIAQWVPKRGIWRRVGRGGALRIGEHQYRWSELAPGRHRVFDAQSGCIGPEFVIVPGANDRSMTLDLTECRNLPVILDLPEQVSREDLKIELLNRETPWNVSLKQDDNGNYHFRLPGREFYRIRPYHPLCQLDSGADFLEIPQGAGSVKLRMVLAPMVQVAIEDVPPRVLKLKKSRLFLRSVATPEETISLPLQIFADKLVAGNIPEEEQDIWLDTGEGPVAFLGRRRLLPGEILKRPVPTEGSTLSIDPPEHVLPGRKVTLILRALEAPFQKRIYKVPADKKVTLDNLSPGRFELKISPAGFQFGIIRTHKILLRPGQTTTVVQ